MENNMEAPQKTKSRLSYDLAIPLLGIDPKECKKGYNKDTSIAMFIATLSTLADLRK
jgi:hypothetical protein